MFNNFVNSKQRCKIKFGSKSISIEITYFSHRDTFKRLCNLDTGTKEYKKIKRQQI
jgi:hypothetical protein